MSCHCLIYIVLGTSQTIKRYEVPKSSDLIGLLKTVPGQIAGTKKPTGLAPCGLLGLHRMKLVIFDGLAESEKTRKLMYLVVFI